MDCRAHLRHPDTSQRAIVRLTIPAATASAFMNNTPLVAMLIPAVSDWSKQIRVAASKLMIPLSYAAILGGTCTLIGTSTNIIVNGLVIEAAKTNNALPPRWIGNVRYHLGRSPCLCRGSRLYHRSEPMAVARSPCARSAIATIPASTPSKWP